MGIDTNNYTNNDYMKKLMVKVLNRWHTLDFTANDEANITSAKSLIEDVKWSNPIKKNKRKKVKPLKVAILNNEYYVYVLIGKPKDSIEWINACLDENYGLDITSNRGYCFYQRGVHPIIWVNKKGNWYSLAHEAVHAVEYIFNEIGEESHHEVFAHSVGAIVRAVQEEHAKR